MSKINFLDGIEYDAIMQAIERYRDELAALGDAVLYDDTGATHYTASALLEALERVEMMIVADNIPR